MMKATDQACELWERISLRWEPDADSTLGQRSVPRIGARTKNIRKNNITRQIRRVTERYLAIPACLASNR